MTAARAALLALAGLMLATPFAFADKKKSGSTVTITYTYKTYGS